MASDKEIKDIIRKELQAILKEYDYNIHTIQERQYMPDDSLKTGNPESDASLILTPNEIKDSNPALVFNPSKGDKIEFDIEGLKYGSGEILGYSESGEFLYIKLPTGNYIKINLLVDSKSIKRIEIDNWVIQQKV